MNKFIPLKNFLLLFISICFCICVSPFRPFFFSLLMSSQCVCRLISHVSDPWRAEFHLSLCKGSRSWSVPLASCPHVRSSSVDYNQCQSSPSLPTLLLCHAAPDSLHLTPTWSSVTFHISICRSTSHLGSFARNQLSCNLDLPSMLRKLPNNI